LGIQSTIENSAASFTPAMQRVADAIRAEPTVVLDRTISELAGMCDTSVASVVRFCRALGLTGYAQLRRSLATELGKESAQFGLGMTLGAEIARSDSLQDVANKIASLEMLAIQETVSSLDYQALQTAVTLMDEASRILLFGVGASHFVAQDLHHKLFRIGRNVFIMADSHEAWTAATLAPKGTVALGFSHSGSTGDTVRYLEIAKQSGARTIAITGSAGSPLTRVGDVCLISHARESHLRAGAMVSRIAQLAIVDCLFMGLARQSYDETIDALKRTRDVTHSGR
jgi:DNA-binding MurR/RpiR family transcriptional regulator